MVTRNRIELEGRVLDAPESRTTPAGTPILRFTVECGEAVEELRLGIVSVGELALATQPLLKRGSNVKVIGRLRALKGKLKTDAAIEVVATSIEPEKA